MRAMILTVVFNLGCYAAHVEPGEADPPTRHHDAAFPALDAGPPTVVCEANAPTEYTGPGCTEEIRSCLRRCAPGTDECWSCYLRHRDCYDCEYFAYATCTVERSCQADWDALACCRATRCDGLDMLTCEEGHCRREFDAFEWCGERFYDDCGEAGRACGAREG